MSNYFAFKHWAHQAFLRLLAKSTQFFENGIPQYTLLNSSKVGRRMHSPSNMQCSGYKKVWWTYELQTYFFKTRQCYICLATVTCITSHGSQAFSIRLWAALSWASSWLMDAKAIPSSCRRSWTRQDETARDGSCESFGALKWQYDHIFFFVLSTNS